MKNPSLVSHVQHGREQSKRTNWQVWNGFAIATLSDGTTRYIPEEKSHVNGSIEYLEQKGIDCSEFKRSMGESERKLSYPPKPQAELFWTGYDWKKPCVILNWEWSTTFGQWGATVQFSPEEQPVFTYPKTF